jgi:hypothetical protein
MPLIAWIVFLVHVVFALAGITAIDAINTTANITLIVLRMKKSSYK